MYLRRFPTSKYFIVRRIFDLAYWFTEDANFNSNEYN